MIKNKDKTNKEKTKNKSKINNKNSISNISDTIYTTENGLENVRKKFQSNDDFKIFLEKQIDNYKKKLMLETGKSVLPTNASNTDIYKIITSYFDLRYVVQNDNESNKPERTFYIQNYNSEFGLWEELDLEGVVVYISELFIISDIHKTVRDISIRLRKSTIQRENIKPLNLPPNYIILTPNVVYNLKTMKSSTQIDAFGQFDFINNVNFRILPLNKVNPIKLEIVKRIFNDWSQGDKNIEIYLKQLCIAALDGNGRGVFHILIGSGGNGKSSFLNILETLSGKKYTVKLNLQDYMNDNKIGKISSATKSVIGHDLATGAKLSSALNSRFKEFVTAEAFMVDVKYKDPKIIQSRSLKIQSTNTLLDIFENTDAMRRRMRLFEWTNVNFTKLVNERTFNLDELIGTAIDTKLDKEFYEALMAYCFNEMEYFDKFIEIESINKATNKMINDSDAVYNFFIWFLEQELNNFHKMPLNILYELYKVWHNQENPSGYPLKQRAFSERLKKIINQFGYVFSDERQRISSIESIDFNPNLISEVFFKNNLIYNNRTMHHFIENDKTILQGDIDEFKKKIHLLNSVDELTMKELIILYHLIENGDTEAMHLKNSK
jgi:phage/plasmid-associated DNA primase